jgi:hypothetical protein
VTAAIYVLAVLAAGIALGAGAALITFAVSWSPWRTFSNRVYRAKYPGVVVRFQDRRS